MGRWCERGQAKRHSSYGSTRLPPASAAPARLLARKRGHGQIEKGLHETKEVTGGEDRSRSHVGAGPTVMALLRDTALTRLRRGGHRALARQLRARAAHPLAARALVGDPPPITHP